MLKSFMMIDRRRGCYNIIVKFMLEIHLLLKKILVKIHSNSLLTTNP